MGSAPPDVVGSRTYQHLERDVRQWVGSTDSAPISRYVTRTQRCAGMSLVGDLCRCLYVCLYFIPSIQTPMQISD